MGMQYDHKAGHRIAKRLTRMADRAEDVTPAWPRVGAYLSRQVRKQFSSRGKHMNTPWKPLAASTRKEKRRKGYGRIPLVRSGDLRSSFIGRPMNIEVYRKDSATFGSGLNKAVWQQSGTRRHGKQHIPPRPMLELTPEIRKGATAILRKYIVGRSKGIS